MSLSRLLLKLPGFRLIFLLPLLLPLVAFSLGGEQLTNQMLRRSYAALDKLQADNPHPELQLAVKAMIISTKFEKKREYTQVEIKTINSTLKALEFQFPATELSIVKAMLAQKLGLSPEVKNFPVGTQIQMQLAVNVAGILAAVEEERGFTTVEVKTANSVLRKLEFEFPVTELSQVKTAIAQELGLSPDSTEKFVSYRVKK
jgi:hypothetical protein